MEESIGKQISRTAIDLLPLGLIYLLLAKNLNLLPSDSKTPPSTNITPACPRGTQYTRGFFGDCDPGYVAKGWLQDVCECIDKTIGSCKAGSNCAEILSFDDPIKFNACAIDGYFSVQDAITGALIGKQDVPKGGCYSGEVYKNTFPRGEYQLKITDYAGNKVEFLDTVNL